MAIRLATDPGISALELSRLGLAFRDPATERAYREWHRADARTLARVGFALSILTWIGVSIVGPLSQGVRPDALTVIWLVLMPLIVAGLATSYSPRFQAWTQPMAAFANSAAALVALWMSIDPMSVEASFLVTIVIIAAYFVFTIFRLRPAMAAIATVPYISYELHVLNGLRDAGAMSDGQLAMLVFATFVGVGSGLFACCVVDRISRHTYRQGVIVEQQRATIERERARADVADRARELTEALSRLTSSKSVAPRLSAGDVIGNRYRVIKTLGAGGMGEVHEVERLADERRFALKVLKGGASHDALFRFAREAQVAAKLDHPNIVRVIEVDVADYRMYLVMELIEGGSLAAERARFGQISWALRTLAAVADALATMHEAGIVHRDLKPANILVDAGAPRVADFGIASLGEEAPAPTGADDTAVADGNLTRTGMIMGTPLYMAPELAAGAQAAKPSADIWSLGVLAHELLTGRLPFTDPPFMAQMAGRRLQEPPALDVTGLDPAVIALLVRCLAVNPDARPTARDLATGLARATSLAA